MRLYHPDLDRTFETGNDSEAQFAVLAESGWVKAAIPLEQTDPALAAVQPDDAVLAPPVVAEKAKAVTKKTAKTD